MNTTKDLYEARKRIQVIYKNSNLNELESRLNEKLNKKNKKFIEEINVDPFNLSIMIKCNVDNLNDNTKIKNNIIDTTKSVLKDFVIENADNDNLVKDFLSTNYSLICDTYSIANCISFIL